MWAIPRVREFVSMETIKSRKAKLQRLTQRQFDIVVGSLLGDAYLVKTSCGYAFRVNHSMRQRDYVDWKYEALENLVNSRPRSSNACYYFRTVSHPTFDLLRNAFYSRNEKKLPFEIENWLTPLALAVWVMDDGGRDGNQLRINSLSLFKRI